MLTSIAVSSERLELAYQSALSLLLAQRREGHWTGELAGSPLATATAAAALACADQDSSKFIRRGLDWLVQQQNADGGWGDTPLSSSNIRTSMICRAAFALTQSAETYAGPVGRLEDYLNRHCGIDPTRRAAAVRQCAVEDSTIAVPVLVMCALAGLVSWDEVPPLPFELACVPPSWFRLARLPVAGYAMPALVAFGCAKYYHCRPWNPLTRSLRFVALHGGLRFLESSQPSSGGFLESIPLTSLVTLCLATSACADHAVTRQAVEFLRRTVRADGSWSVDVNLATRVTAMACTALAAASELAALPGLQSLERWLLDQQFHEANPYTSADAGGWSWSDSPGTIPDVEDTAAVLLALESLRETQSPALAYAVALGLQWLLSVQNHDGGWPALCRGHGRLMIERSTPELTAQALRAIMAWFGDLPDIVALASRYCTENRPAAAIDGGVLEPLNVLSVRDRGLDFLAQAQRGDGSWLPLWFGNDDASPAIGTARVLAAYGDLDKMDSEPAHRGVDWLIMNHQPDGGWGGTEETALAVDVLMDANPPLPPLRKGGNLFAPPLTKGGQGGGEDSRLGDAVNSGLARLVQQVEGGALHQPRPIAYSFDKLGYLERLYPILFAVSALGKARHLPQHAVS